ncbi:hypothetical protein [Streptosporangium carneum]|uniref:Uncharacterized protein n=1 Tax=Streptosporangium carneum TaxID=47481 RepID=A0A9W6I8Y0_9ACTN|nr:hypothetical protein [Streptosporangium carneum]GLK13596.1 hypothetical protein GCM10017600_70070 [Streptosporangium carneum]
MSAPEWPSLDDVAHVTEFDTYQMRKIASELEEWVAGLTAPAFSEGYTTGSLKSVDTSGNLTEDQIGTWPTAHGFTRTVGAASGAAASLDGRTAVLGRVYGEVVAQYLEVIKAIRASADEYDKANHASGGGDGSGG